jgi:hypothetical protein
LPLLPTVLHELKVGLKDEHEDEHHQVSDANSCDELEQPVSAVELLLPWSASPNPDLSAASPNPDLSDSSFSAPRLRTLLKHQRNGAPTNIEIPNTLPPRPSITTGNVTAAMIVTNKFDHTLT